MKRLALVSAFLFPALLFPTVGSACESVNREQCKQRFAALVTYRTEAITNAFGDLLGTLPGALQVRFVGTQDLADSDGRETYDQEHRTLVFPRRLLSAKVPNPMRAAAYYWPFYENDQYRTTFPVTGKPAAFFPLARSCGQCRSSSHNHWSERWSRSNGDDWVRMGGG